jgi:hypothetical protein
MNLVVSVEGVSEEAFVNRLLRPHLQLHGWSGVTPVGVATSLEPDGRRGGLTNWPAVEQDLRDLFNQYQGPDYRFTSLWDFYGTPDSFPGFAAARATPPGTDRAAIVEGKLSAHFHEPRFLPYVQMYEFEALVLAAIDGLKELHSSKAAALAALKVQCEAVGNFETINDGPTTHPARRIDAVLPGFWNTKEDDGPIALRTVGLDPPRRWCPRFNQWVARLERIGESRGQSG